MSRRQNNSTSVSVNDVKLANNSSIGKFNKSSIYIEDNVI